MSEVAKYVATMRLHKSLVDDLRQLRGKGYVRHAMCIDQSLHACI